MQQATFTVADVAEFQKNKHKHVRFHSGKEWYEYKNQQK
jgi:hypothetical protein